LSVSWFSFIGSINFAVYITEVTLENAVILLRSSWLLRYVSRYLVPDVARQCNVLIVEGIHNVTQCHMPEKLIILHRCEKLKSLCVEDGISRV
jgi:hypothetical protein